MSVAPVSASSKPIPAAMVVTLPTLSPSYFFRLKSASVDSSDSPNSNQSRVVYYPPALSKDTRTGHRRQQVLCIPSSVNDGVALPASWLAKILADSPTTLAAKDRYEENEETEDIDLENLNQSDKKLMKLVERICADQHSDDEAADDDVRITKEKRSSTS